MKIAVVGFGVVGSGVLDFFYKNKDSIEKKIGKELDIKYILVRRDISNSQYADKAVFDLDTIISDPEISLVIEAMGGLNPAYEYTKRCLEASKHIVSSNKELVSQHGAELLALAKKHDVNYLFEASVGGGIPIIHPLYQCLGFGRIEEIAGILNGTTNFIMTRMISDKMSFDDALKLAQKNGYAEADPTADIEGFDASRKICILASIAFGKHVYPDEVYTEGITNISAEDVSVAQQVGYAVKLIARVKKMGDKLLSLVTPALVPITCQFANVSDTFNSVLIRSEDTGDTVFYGRGAGKLPTASAIISDVIEAIKTGNHNDALYWEDSAHDTVLSHLEDETEVMFRIKGLNIPPEFKAKKVICSQNESTAFISSKINGSELEELRKQEIVISSIRVLEY